MIRSNAVKDLAALQKYVEGVKLLKDPALNPWPGQANLSIYDSLVAWHHRAMMISTPAGQMARNAAHGGPSFLPWHRYFLVRLESLLRKAVNDPHFRIPYWDWNTDAELQDPRTSVIWSNQYLGQFVDGKWRVRLMGDGRTMELGRVNRPLVRYLGEVGRCPAEPMYARSSRKTPCMTKCPTTRRNPPVVRATASRDGLAKNAFTTTSMCGSAVTWGCRLRQTTRCSFCIIAMSTGSGRHGKRSIPPPLTYLTQRLPIHSSSIGSMTRCTALFRKR